MKENQDAESVIGFDALYASMCKCRKGVIWKDSVASFSLRGIEKTMKLCDDLHNDTYIPSPPKHFMVTSPKPREIASIAYRDRIYQRSLNDNVVYPAMVRSFIHANFACQKGKGTDAARDYLMNMLRKYYRKHGCEGYVAQFDIHGYYPNMSHRATEALFERKLEPWAFERVQRILRTQYDGDKGYNPGSQLVQIAGISMLDELDHFIKERLHIRFYVRYMDDFILIHEDKSYLESCKREIIKGLEALEFEINPKKTQIFKLKERIEFLGFHFRLTDTGKVLMHIRSCNVRAQRRKLRRLVKKSKRGDLPRNKVDDSYYAWRNHASKGNSWKLLQRMDRYYKELWKLEVD